MKCISFQYDASNSESLYLASGSQDGTIRIWKIAHLAKNSPFVSETEELLDSLEASFDGNVEAEEGGRQKPLTHHLVTVNMESERLAT